MNIILKDESLLQKAYNKDIRNAISHTQYYLVPGGFVLTNKECKNNQSLYGFTFEQWEEIYSNAWLLFKYIFNGLKDIMELFYVPLATHASPGGIKILVPRGTRKWEEKDVYYFERGHRWIFHKPE